MKETVLVTGGAGFIGSHTVDKLIEQNYNVIVVDNLSTGKNLKYAENRMNYIDDILSNLDYIFQENKIDYIIHLAAKLSVPESMTNPKLYHDNNVDGTFNILKLAYQYNVKKVVLASTCAVEGNSYYGLSKLIGESIAAWFTLNYNVPTTCLRYVNVYGERQASFGEGAVVPAFINCLKNNESPIIHGTGEQTRDYVYVQDVAEANIHAMKHEFIGVTYVATGKEISVNALLAEIAFAMNKQYTPIYKAKRDGDMMSVGFHYPLGTFEWTPRFSLEEGLKNTVKYFIETN